jgi:peptide/nickel transport system permease protein
VAGYLLRRVLLSIPTLIAISMVLFAIVTLAPGDPLGAFALDPSITPEIREQIRVSLGLDQPLPIRYIRWLTAFLRGDMGYSFTTHSPVRDLIGQRLGTTLLVVGSGYVVSVAVALPVGVLSALRPRSLFDKVVSLLTLSGYSIPPFLTGVMFILVFSVWLRWFPFIYRSMPITTWSDLVAQVRQLVLPVLVVAIFQAALLLRFVRSAALEQAAQDYVTAARARGLRETAVVLRHVVRNALIPVVTLVALSIPNVFTGALVTEQIFRVPGIGSLLIRSIESSDTPVVMAIVFLYAILVLVFNLVADVLYGLLDPRVRF